MAARLIACVLLLFAGCTQPGDAPVQVLVGGSLEDGKGGAPVDPAVVVIEKGLISAVGVQTHLPVPRGSSKTDTSGYRIRPVGGGTIEPGKPATLELVDPSGAVARRMNGGVWE